MELKNILRQYTDKFKTEKSERMNVILIGNTVGEHLAESIRNKFKYDQGICCLVKDGVLEKKNGKKANDVINLAVILVDNKEKISTIKKVKIDGADIIIAYYIWSKDSEKKMARQIANAGADYIVGVKSDGEIDKYNVIETEDKRKVPFVMSVGDVTVSTGSQYSEYLVIELEIEKTASGITRIVSEKIKPYVTTLLQGEHKLFSLEDKLSDTDVKTNIYWEERLFNIGKKMGNLAISKLDISKEYNPYNKLKLTSDTGEIASYTIGKLPIAKKKQNINNKNDNTFFYDDESGCYIREQNNRENEARLVCAGQIVYDTALERGARSFDKYEFAKNFKLVSKCFEETDLVVGNMTSMVARSYPTMTQISNSSNLKTYYRNARTEFAETLKSAGFSCLAMANPYNVCTGVDGIFETEEVLKKNNIIASGLGRVKNPVILMNGIKIAVLSYMTECFFKSDVISDEGANAILNEYEVSEVKKTIKSLKENGAEFVLLYLNCGNGKNNLGVKRRKELAEKIAESGADYLICTIPVTISQYYRYKTEDNRVVPIATSLGSFIAGNSELSSVLLKIIVRKTFDGKIEVTDNFIPIRNAQNTIIPMHEHFYAKWVKEADEDTVQEILEKLGDEIALNSERKVKAGSYFRSHYTLKELCEFLNAELNAEEMEILKDKWKMPVKCVVSRKDSLVSDCVAVLTEDDLESAISIEDAVEKGAVLVVAEKKYSELPTLVVESACDAIASVGQSILEKCNPIRVAITGSVGKTTTKDMTSMVFGTHYKEFHIEGNFNTLSTVREVVQKLEESDQVYIQEVSGGSIGTCHRCSEFIKPDICIVTSIAHAHIEVLGSIENVTKNKLQIIDGMKENGVLLLNDDNEYLHEQQPPVKTIRYSAHNPECDYYAQNIVMKEDEIEFQIVSKGGEFDKPGIYDAKLNIQGEHNVLNAVGVFAAARQANIPPHKIISGLSSFRTSGVRQNLLEKDGYKLLIDAYNSNPSSLLSAVKTIHSIEPENGGKKVLVLGDMYEQGEDSVKIHYDTGVEISKYDFDILLCSGRETKHLVQAAKENGKLAYFISDKEIFNQIVSQVVRTGDAVLFKASGGENMKETTILPVFGKMYK